MPAPSDSDGNFIGGIFKDRGEGRDLTGYDAITFWATGTVTGSITEVQPINGNLPSHYIYVKDTSTGLENSFFNGCKQTQATTIDGGPAFETFVTNPNTLKVSDSGRGSGEPILEVE